jgi:hypothetical protein
VTGNAPSSTDQEAVWQVGFGERTVAMDATGTERRAASLVAVGVSLASAVLLLIWGLVRLRRRYRAGHRGGAHLADQAR